MRVTVFAALLASLMMFVSGAVYAGSPEEAADYAMAVGNDATAILDQDISGDEKLTKLSELFIRHVDTDWIGKFVLGRNWRTMSDEKQRDYLTHYRDFLIGQYTANFKEYAQGTRFEVTQSRPIGSKGDQYFVTTRIKRDNGEPVIVEYRVRQNVDKSFSVIDIVVEGVSLLATQRSEFATVIQRKGVDYLIDKLRARRAEPVVDKMTAEEKSEVTTESAETATN